jgi:hypothetical protein
VKKHLAEFNKSFEKIRCIKEDHTTPFGTKQDFLICGFKKHRKPILSMKIFAFFDINGCYFL